MEEKRVEDSSGDVCAEKGMEIGVAEVSESGEQDKLGNRR
jgi:hypothetical protein